MVARSPGDMAEPKLQLEDWLDDLCVRFIINLPQEELESVERICFQVEEAQWFYEDFIRPLDPTLPSLNLKQFSLRIFQHCPLFSEFSAYHHTQAFSEFLAYKTRVPVRGAIMLNDAMDQVLLVKGWKKGANWSFPRGKINKDEKDLDCAVREVYEETGFDAREAGVVLDESEAKFIEVTMREQNMRLYIFRGIPMDINFQPRTRKEISKIEWHKLADLPTFKKSKQNPYEAEESTLAVNANKFYMVAPFLKQLKTWIALQKKLDAQKVASTTLLVPVPPFEEPMTEEEPATENEAGPSIQFGAARGIEARPVPPIEVRPAQPIEVRAVPPVESRPSPPEHLRTLLGLFKQPKEPSSLPEVSDVEDSMQDASAQLKRLLKVPEGPSVYHPLSQTPSAPAYSEGSHQSTLLALLQGNGPTGGATSQSTSPPKTILPSRFVQPHQVPLELPSSEPGIFRSPTERVIRPLLPHMVNPMLSPLEAPRPTLDTRFPIHSQPPAPVQRSTPISPADREFLYNFLEDVAKTSRRY